MFYSHCGIDTGNIKEGLAQLPNAQFIGKISHRVDARDGETIFAEIDRTAPLS